ncbi:HAMP domain-containing protein [Paenibacillus sp. DXFW5]|uniref:histidine kinase n=2 Tax=Paenibacillus TaxID=44249 RepID=A0ABS2H190_9BACL|nr:HAMP domain-containing protein [Paenibacillus rhizolycopersici]GIP46753.1 two-component sensor histidine kinase [Paenibacillus sp. J53TS2]
MTVSRKLFLVIAAFIFGVSLMFMFFTYFTIRDSLEVMLQSSRTEELNQLEEEIEAYYEKHGSSWTSLTPADLARLVPEGRLAPSIGLMDAERRMLAVSDDLPVRLLERLGIHRELSMEGKTIGWVYYYDSDVANLSKLRIGTPISVVFLVGGGAVVFMLLSLGAAFFVSRWLTSPLRRLVPIIDRLGRGEFGIQAPVNSKDEYGKVAQAINGMSAQLARAEEVRRNLVADVAHELRTPLTIIRGKLDLLQQGGGQIQPEHLLPIQDEMIRLTRLVGDLHQLSLAEAGKLPLDLRPTDMGKLLREVVERVSWEAEAKNITLSMKVMGNRSIVSADAERMMQVFLNLLHNAIRYTPEDGRVMLTLRDVDVASTVNPSPRPMLQIRVQDTGPGVSPEHLPYLFNRFYRTDEARSRHAGGMGLGLAIAKEFVANHLGTLEAESRPGEGTAFIVTLPIIEREHA